MDTTSGTSHETPRSQWYETLADLGAGSGGLEFLGPSHAALYSEGGATLLVSFESGPLLRKRGVTLPIGVNLAEESGWSHLTVITEARDWFRTQVVYGFFDRLVDDAFFDGFERVVFYGAGPCGYAAAAFSVAAPGATVLALAPQATLDPRVTEWDPRFTRQRRLNFTDRYGYAPDMLDGAEQAYVLYDPANENDAMHAALFARPNVSRLRCRLMDGDLDSRLEEMGILSDLIDAACEGLLDEAVFWRLYRARRSYPLYLRRLLRQLDDDGRSFLAAILCRHVVEDSGLRMPRFRKRFKEFQDELKARDSFRSDATVGAETEI